MTMRGITTQLLATFATCLAALSSGFHIGWSSPSLIKLQAQDSDLPITSDQGSWLVSILLLGSLFGGIIGGIVVIKWGRKLSLLLTSVPYIIACILIGVAQNYWCLILGRSFAAIGFGSANTISPLYLGEIAEPKIRGTLVVLINQMINIGILLAYCVGPWVSRLALAGVGLSLPIIFAIAFFRMPESPYFLVMKKDKKAAETSLAWFRGTSDVKDELSKIETSIAKEDTGTVRELVMIPGNRKALLILTLLWSVQHLSGDAVILNYTSLIFEASGSQLSTNISVIIIGVMSFLGGVLSIFTVDLFGRRPLLLLSLCGSIVFLTGEALYFQLQSIGTDVSSIYWLPVTAIVGYVVFFAIGIGCLPYVILSEILPCNLKATAGMYSMIITALSGTFVSKLYPAVADAYGIYVPFWAFVACSSVMTIFIFFILPETKQRTLQDIQDELRGTTITKISVRNIVSSKI